MPRKSANRRQADSFVARSVQRTPVIYEIVRRRGEEEMARPTVSLWWSGVAAGLSISFSLLAQTILYHHLPEAIWRPLVVGLGYPVGFLMVVLARQQLFTENTITVVLPVMAEPTRANFASLGRMWSVVLAANFAGTLGAALIASFTPVLTPGLHATMMEISRHAMAADWLHMFFLGAPAGFLIAAMVWLLPNARASQFFVIGLMTYLIGVGGYEHIVAGSVESFLLVVNGEMGVGTMITGFAFPVLLGNILGGTALFALISYAQVMREL